MLALKQSNVLLELELDAGAQLALPKSVQRDPVRHVIEHVDLVVVRSGEKVTVEVSVGPRAEIGGGIVEPVLDTMALEVEATKIPGDIVVDVEGLEAGQQRARRRPGAAGGAVLVADPDLVSSTWSARSSRRLRPRGRRGGRRRGGRRALGAAEAAAAAEGVEA